MNQKLTPGGKPVDPVLLALKGVWIEKILGETHVDEFDRMAIEAMERHEDLVQEEAERNIEKRKHRPRYLTSSARR